MNEPKVCTLDLNWIWLFRSANVIDSVLRKSTPPNTKPTFKWEQQWKTSSTTATTKAIILSKKWIRLRLQLKLPLKRAPCAVCIVITLPILRYLFLLFGSLSLFSSQSPNGFSNRKHRHANLSVFYLDNLLDSTSEQFLHSSDNVEQSLCLHISLQVCFFLHIF